MSAKRNKISSSLVALMILAGGLFIYLDRQYFADAFTNSGTTEVANLTDNRGDYAGGNIPKYEKLELTFDINRLDAANGSFIHNLNTEVDNGDINPYWPYEEVPTANQAPPWDQTVNYIKWDRVSYNDKVYVAEQGSDNSYWDPSLPYPLDTLVRYEGFYYKCIINDVCIRRENWDPNDSPYNDAWEKQGAVNPALTPGNTEEYWKEGDPAPVKTDKNISVDGLFLKPGGSWANTDDVVVQPAFYYQDYTRTPPSGTPANEWWVHPEGDAKWKIRFAPTEINAWQYRIRITDKTGTTYTSNTENFIAVDSSNHGFVKVSPTDGRYFELSDGTYLPVIATNATTTDPNDIPTLGQMGVNLVRSWWTVTGNWNMFGMKGQGGTLWSNGWDYSGDKNIVRPGKYAVLRVLPNKPLELTRDLWVKSDTKYKISAWVKTNNLTVDQAAADAAGNGDIAGLSVGPKEKFFVAIPTVKDTTTTDNPDDLGWIKIEGVLNSGANTNNLKPKIAVNYTTGGEAYVSEISMKECKNEDCSQLGAEMIPMPDMQTISGSNQATSFSVDRIMDQAKEHNVYVKPILGEKLDIFYQGLNPDGSGFGAVSGEQNYFGRPSYVGRSYQEFYWRYIIARYGYNTALHSVEYVNEAEPWGYSIGAANDFANFFQQNDPNRRLASTSNFHSFSVSEYSQPYIGYGDIHRYIGWLEPDNNVLLAGWERNQKLDDTNDPGNAYGFYWDETVSHQGKRSLKIINQPSLDSFTTGEGSKLVTLLGAPSNHTVKLTFWVKGQNLVPYQSGGKGPVDIQITYTGDIGNGFVGWPGGDVSVDDIKDCPDAEIDGWPVTCARLSPYAAAPDYNYDWTPVQYVFEIPEINKHGIPGTMQIQIVSGSTNSASSGVTWFDDISFQDLGPINDPYPTPIMMNYNGGFEYIEPIIDDVVAGHQSISQEMFSYKIGKPIIRGEIGFVNTREKYGNPFLGYSDLGYQAQVIDKDGIWWKKWVWSHLDFGGLIEMLWEEKPLLGGKWNHAQAYRSFLSDLLSGEHKISNGKYYDVDAKTSTSDLRVIGQKEIISGNSDRAHMWIDNAPYTWKAVVNHNFNYNDIAWSPTTDYPLGSKISFNGRLYDNIKQCVGWSDKKEYRDGDYVAASVHSVWSIYRATSTFVSYDITSEIQQGLWVRVDPNYTGWSVPPPGYATGPINDVASQFWGDEGPVPSVNPPLPTPVTGTITIPDMKAGIYRLAWYNTSTGEIDHEENLASNGSDLIIPIANLESDIALKVEITSVTPVSIINSKTFTYKTTYKVDGTKSADIIKVLVNDSEAELDNTNQTWTVNIDLAIGQNTITAIGEDAFGSQSAPSSYTVSRRKMADANNDGSIGLVDLSVLAANWKKTEQNNPADFNEDGDVNLVDLSLLSANWERRVTRGH